MKLFEQISLETGYSNWYKTIEFIAVYQQTKFERNQSNVAKYISWNHICRVISHDVLWKMNLAWASQIIRSWSHTAFQPDRSIEKVSRPVTEMVRETERETETDTHCAAYTHTHPVLLQCSTVLKAVLMTVIDLSISSALSSALTARRILKTNKVRFSYMNSSQTVKW